MNGLKKYSITDLKFYTSESEEPATGALTGRTSERVASTSHKPPLKTPQNSVGDSIF